VEGPSEEGAQTDGRKYDRNKKEVSGCTNRMDRMVSVGFNVDDADVLLRSKYMLGNLIKLHVTLDDLHKDMVKFTVFRAALEYGVIEMDWDLTLALVKCWAPRWKAFRLAGHRVLF